MTRYLAQRLAQLLPVLLIASFLVFVLLHLVPGDPALILAGGDADAQTLAAVRRDFGLDRPLLVQYGLWLEHVVRGDLGKSMISRFPVGRLLGLAFPASLELAVAAILIAVAVGIPVGVWAAVRQGTRTDVVLTGLTSVALGVPSFWFGILLVILFALVLGWLPPSGRVPLLANPAVAARFLTLPAITLALHILAQLTRFTKSAMLEVLQEPYVRTARAKGLAERVVIARHALRNALLPVVTVLGIQFGRLLGGSVIVEAIFGWPGVGRLVLQSVGNRDYPVVQGALLAFVGVAVMINLLTDVAYATLDPRIRFDAGGEGA